MFNFSNEVQLTVIELVSMILTIMNREDLEPIILNEAKGEIKHQYLSAAKARKILGWRPLYFIKSGLEKTIE